MEVSKKKNNNALKKETEVVMEGENEEVPKEETEEVLTVEKEESLIGMKYTYLTVALGSALYSFYEKGRKTWQEYCEESIVVMQNIPMGIYPIIRWKTVMDWFAHF
eukprot:4830029-Ditylum_brightwellii.AAC.2